MTSEGLNFCNWRGEILRYFLCATLLLLKLLWQNGILSSVPVLLCAYSLAYVVQVCSGNLTFIVLWSEFVVCFVNKNVGNAFHQDHPLL